MTGVVFVVTLNNHVFSVHATPESADAAMARYRQKLAGDNWRPVGVGGWASNSTTHLGRRAWTVEE